MFIKTENWILQNTLAYFPIVLNIDNNGSYTLDSSDIEYHAANMSINHEFFWQNTQWLIYHTVNYKASLMSLLFGSLKTKRSLHFLTKTRSDIDNIDVSVEINAFDDICVNLEFPCDCVYDDTNMAYHSMLDKIDNLSQLVSNGYKFAENNKTPDNNLIDKINNISTCVAKKLYEKISNENLESLLSLCKVAVAYIYPTYNFNNKAFSTILSKYIDVKSNLEISNGGLFLLWDGVNNAERIIDIIAHDPTFFQVRVDAIQYCFNITTSAMLNRVLRESLKSAVSAIMTRNMSHNLGSHYLHYTKMQLDQLAKNTRKFGPDIRGAAKVMGYMQGRMDFLATLISGDRYPYGCVNFKSQIYDELTIDDFSKRHFKKKDAGHRTTNFLLTNLIWSEGFTRSNIIDGTDAENSVNIHIRYNNCIFTGSAQRKIANRENHVKQKLSEINIAMPGGVMSCHAFFNVVENFIRNSAKYHQQDFQNIKNLTTTIKISETKENNFDVYEFVIYDNKQNAYSKEHFNNEESDLITSIKNRLSSLRILDDNNAVEKSNKGFKEMLFSTIWMRSFVFMQKDGDGVLNSFSDVLATIQSTPDGDEKLKLIEKYGFSVMAVDGEGEPCLECSEKANFAIRFTLPKFKNQFEVSLVTNNEYNDNLLISRLLNVYGDCVYVNQNSFDQLIKELNNRSKGSAINKDLVIPRMADKIYESDTAALEYVLRERFGNDFDNYKICIDNIKEDRKKVENSYKIYFQKHLSTKADINNFKDHAYADSISGGNFTLTLSEIFNRWKEKDWDKNAPEYYEILKIKESALTRITLIDERLYNEMLNQDKGVELACKNIRVLNYIEPSVDNMYEDSINSLVKLFQGNKFNLGENSTHFLSIHLGIIEKIIKNSNVFNSMKDEFGKEYGEYSEQERTIMFMNLLKKHFGYNKQEVFISIHSGRGNYSAELNGPLSIYPFISMSAIENAFNNSKYLLSQLFYSTIYLGKGIINH